MADKANDSAKDEEIHPCTGCPASDCPKADCEGCKKPEEYEKRVETNARDERTSQANALLVHALDRVVLDLATATPVLEEWAESLGRI